MIIIKSTKRNDTSLRFHLFRKYKTIYRFDHFYISHRYLSYINKRTFIFERGRKNRLYRADSSSNDWVYKGRTNKPRIPCIFVDLFRLVWQFPVYWLIISLVVTSTSAKCIYTFMPYKVHPFSIFVFHFMLEYFNINIWVSYFQPFITSINIA